MLTVIIILSALAILIGLHMHGNAQIKKLVGPKVDEALTRGETAFTSLEHGIVKDSPKAAPAAEPPATMGQMQQVSSEDIAQMIHDAMFKGQPTTAPADLIMGRDSFMKSIANSTQAVLLDGVPVHPGSMPPLAYQTNSDKSITKVPDAPVSAWPKLIQVNSPMGPLNCMADAPINPQWLPPMAWWTFASGRSYVSDPSNGKALGLPTRSPAGFPLRYAVAPDGKGGSVAVGTPTVTYGDDGFNSDAEVMDFIARTKNPGQSQQTFQNVAQSIADNAPGQDVAVPIEQPSQQ